MIDFIFKIQDEDIIKEIKSKGDEKEYRNKLIELYNTIFVSVKKHILTTEDRLKELVPINLSGGPTCIAISGKWIAQANIAKELLAETRAASNYYDALIKMIESLEYRFYKEYGVMPDGKGGTKSPTEEYTKSLMETSSQVIQAYYIQQVLDTQKVKVQGIYDELYATKDFILEFSDTERKQMRG